jgi:hypothetical protein
MQARPTGIISRRWCTAAPATRCGLLTALCPPMNSKLLPVFIAFALPHSQHSVSDAGVLAQPALTTSPTLQSALAAPPHSRCPRSFPIAMSLPRPSHKDVPDAGSLAVCVPRALHLVGAGSAAPDDLVANVNGARIGRGRQVLHGGVDRGRAPLLAALLLALGGVRLGGVRLGGVRLLAALGLGLRAWMGRSGGGVRRLQGPRSRRCGVEYAAVEPAPRCSGGAQWAGCPCRAAGRVDAASLPPERAPPLPRGSARWAG